MTDKTYETLETKLVHAGEPRIDGAVRLPIFQSAMYELDPEDPRGASRYIRYFNTPNQLALADKLAALEGGEAAIVTGSGMAAISATLLSLLRAGDHVLSLDSLYGGTHEMITDLLPTFDISHTMFDRNKPESWPQLLRPNTKAVYVETITNPLLRVPDHDAVISFCRQHGLVAVIDNTFASPVNFRPPEFGYDLSVHSMTKYINGHSDVVAGAVIGSKEHIERIRKTLLSLGSALDPHATFLVNRGVNTLSLRVGRQNESALAIAEFLERHPKIVRVSHPGLGSHPDHQRAEKLLDGLGGMIAFEIDGGADAAERFFSRLNIPLIAPSLGGPETVVTRPTITSHAGLTPAEREALGITDGLIRCSVGLEDAGELIADFDQALGD